MRKFKAPIFEWIDGSLSADKQYFPTFEEAMKFIMSNEHHDSRIHDHDDVVVHHHHHHHHHHGHHHDDYDCDWDDSGWDSKIVNKNVVNVNVNGTNKS